MASTSSSLSRWLSLLLFVWLCGLGLSQQRCLPVDDPREKLEELRVLGIKADAPAAKPGDTVKLLALAVDPEGRDLSLEWFQCTSPSDADHGCHTDSNATRLGTGPNATLTVPADYLAGELTAAEQRSGRILPVTLVVRAGEETVVAVKRIVVTPTPSNHNPSITGLLLSSDGTTQPLPSPWTVAVESEYSLSVQVSDDSRETYARTDPNGATQDAKERLYVSWYLSDGSYKKGYLPPANDRSNTLVTPKEKPASGTLTLYFVLRDGRGGVDWMTTQATFP